jgi:hypothetical protein
MKQQELGVLYLDPAAEGLCLMRGGWGQIPSTEDEQTPPRLTISFSLMCCVGYMFQEHHHPFHPKLRWEGKALK